MQNQPEHLKLTTNYKHYCSLCQLVSATNKRTTFQQGDGIRQIHNHPSVQSPITPYQVGQIIHGPSLRAINLFTFDAPVRRSLSTLRCFPSDQTSIVSCFPLSKTAAQFFWITEIGDRADLSSCLLLKCLIVASAKTLSMSSQCRYSQPAIKRGAPLSKTR